jgi:hypothetical protein
MFIVRACYRGADVQAEGSYGSRGRQKALDRYLARATPSRRVGSRPGALGYEVRGGAIRSDASRIPLAWEVAKASQSEARATTRRLENRCWQVCLPAESSRARFECASKYGRWQGSRAKTERRLPGKSSAVAPRNYHCPTHGEDCPMTCSYLKREAKKWGALATSAADTVNA